MWQKIILKWLVNENYVNNEIVLVVRDTVEK